MKLELKHLSGYLPYGLEMYWEDNQYRPQESWELKYESVDFVLNNQNKPILRPLSDLTKEIEVNGEKFVPLIELLRLSNFDVSRMKTKEQLEYEDVFCNMDFISFKDAQKLLEWHFDIYNLIENNLAIDKNTIK